MMPSTVITAILLRESLSSSSIPRVAGRRRAPGWCESRPGRSGATARATNCVKLPNRLNASNTSRMIAKIIQPRLLRGLAGGGGVMIGGGVNGGGTPRRQRWCFHVHIARKLAQNRRGSKADCLQFSIVLASSSFSYWEIKTFRSVRISLSGAERTLFCLTISAIFVRKSDASYASHRPGAPAGHAGGLFAGEIKWFCFDDFDYVVNNHMVRNGLTWAGIRWAFTAWHCGNWHPLTWISHMLDCQLFGLNAGPQHVVNVLFHGVNTALLFLLLFRLTGYLWPGALVAALFAWHPLHVESVAWISERKDVLSTFFGLLTLLFYAGYDRSVGSVRRVGQCLRLSVPTRHFLRAGAGFFALGLMAKPMLVTLPFVMLLLDLWPLQRFSILDFQLPVFRRLLLEKWPFFLLLTASCLVTLLAQRHGQALASFEQIPLNQRLENASVAYGLYLLKMIWPVHLAVFTRCRKKFPGWPWRRPRWFWRVFPPPFGWRANSSPCLLVGWLWFLGTLVPVIGLVQVGSQTMADRYTYFPLIGIFIAVVFGARQLANHLRFPKAIILVPVVMALGACVIITENQLTYWRNNKSLFVHALDATRNNSSPTSGLAWPFKTKAIPAGRWPSIANPRV